MGVYVIGIHNVAKEILLHFNAFEGSKPLFDSQKILIVRGVSRKKMDREKIKKELEKLLEKLDAKEVDLMSGEGSNILAMMDNNIRSEIDPEAESDFMGIEKLKETFEQMNFIVEYKLARKNNIGIFVVVYKDKADVGPCFIEVVVSSLA